MQVKEPTLSMQVPPFMQGDDMHSLYSYSHCVPVNPEKRKTEMNVILSPGVIFKYLYLRYYALVFILQWSVMFRKQAILKGI